MKQKDIALLIVVVFISGFVSFFISRILITSPKNRSEKVEVVQKISSEFPTPDVRYFNSSAHDPTQFINIGDTTNPVPFKDSAQ